MPRVITILLLCILGVLPAQAQTRVVYKANLRDAPPEINLPDINRIWTWLKEQTGAPPALEPPMIQKEALPGTRIMGFFFPSPQSPEEEMRIAIAPDTIKYEPPTMVLWDLGHELAHFLFLLKQYDFRLQGTYALAFPHHCNREFQHVTLGVATVIWNIYHDNNDLSRMNNAVQKACWQAPEE